MLRGKILNSMPLYPSKSLGGLMLQTITICFGVGISWIVIKKYGSERSVETGLWIRRDKQRRHTLWVIEVNSDGAWSWPVSVTHSRVGWLQTTGKGRGSTQMVSQLWAHQVMYKAKLGRLTFYDWPPSLSIFSQLFPILQDLNHVYQSPLRVAFKNLNL